VTRRWNGWGDDTVEAPLPPRTQALLERALGPGRPRADGALPDAIAAAPPSRLAGERGLDVSPETRLRHARGQSFPDWVAARSGRPGALPDAVAFPATAGEARAALSLALERDVRVIPYGGGTSVAGHVNVPPSAAPVLTLSLARLCGLLALDERSHLARFAAGTAGPDVEAALRARGYTLGHFPQSFEYSTVGGWVATRSSGQESLGYGRIERLFAGGVVETPSGPWELPVQPASAAGPDLRQVVLGSEGRLGVITEATVRVRPLPRHSAFRAVFLPEWGRGLEAARALAQSGLPLSMLRLSDAGETEMALSSGARPLPSALDRYFRWRGAGDARCLLLLAARGDASTVRRTLRAALAVAGRHGGVRAPSALAEGWRRHRFRSAYLRNTLWDRGYGVDTVETAATWSALPRLGQGQQAALRDALAAEGEAVHAFTHVSHVYPDGASLYTTYVFRLGAGPDDDLRRWRAMKAAASGAIVAAGGTITHHHGVGTDHREYLAAEKGAPGVDALRALVRQFDPRGLMNPGKLVS
jgi:alkyldihydroxyacetonephosphate synthase